MIRARKRHCDVSVANRTVSDKEFDRPAAEWAIGIPMRVHAPGVANQKCLVKIFFELVDRGVTRVEFVKPGPATQLHAAR